MQPHSAAALALWPPDDTEESVLGTPYHQTTITNVRVGINEAAVDVAPPAAPVPWQAGSQSLILGLRRQDGTAYRVLPDVFVYRRPFDIRRPSLALAQDGPPALVVEILSEETWRSDVDTARGKAWSYAEAGVAEYLILDPEGEFLGDDRGRGWRLEGGEYVPWERDAAGRWVSSLGFAIGYEGAWAVVYRADGRGIPPEGRILRSLAESEARGRAEGEVAMARALLLRLLARRFGTVPEAVAVRLAAQVDVAVLEALADAALDVPTLDAFIALLPG